MSAKPPDAVFTSIKSLKMRQLFKPEWLWLGLTIFLTAFALWGIPRVPFHPDESTYLFMSQDFEKLLSHPLSLAWEPTQAIDLRTHYRLIDAPLTRCFLGLSRSVAGLPALKTDWKWDATWEENQAAGALPSAQLLDAGRIGMTLLLPINFLLIYLIGKRMKDPATGLMATALFGLNALVLLHGRRAMAEGILTFGVLLTIWSFLDGGRKPWLVGLAAAFAINAKQTCIALIPVGLIAISIPIVNENFENKRHRLCKLGLNWVQFGGIIFVITFLLNPVLWKHPIQAAEAGWRERMDLAQRQADDYAQGMESFFTGGLTTKSTALIAHLFIASPTFAEVSNYVPQTMSAEQSYMATPGHNLLRGLVGGGFLMALTLAGILMALLNLRKSAVFQRRTILLLLFSTLALTIAILALLTLPWQRYVMPLVPLTCLWIAYSLDTLFHALKVRT